MDTVIHYPVPLHLQPAYRDLGGREGDFPVAEKAAREILSLPLYPELEDNQVRRIADTVRGKQITCRTQTTCGVQASSPASSLSDRGSG